MDCDIMDLHLWTCQNTLIYEMQLVCRQHNCCYIHPWHLLITVSRRHSTDAPGVMRKYIMLRIVHASASHRHLSAYRFLLLRHERAKHPSEPHSTQCANHPDGSGGCGCTTAAAAGASRCHAQHRRKHAALSNAATATKAPPRVVWRDGRSPIAMRCARAAVSVGDWKATSCAGSAGSYADGIR